MEVSTSEDDTYSGVTSHNETSHQLDSIFLTSI